MVAPQSTVSIPVSFSPVKLGNYESLVEVRSVVNGRSLLWCYPVKGIAEAGAPIRLPGLKTPCKSTLLQEVRIPLEGVRKADLLPGETLQISDFAIEYVTEQGMERVISRTFKAQPLEIVESDGSRDPDMYYAPGKGPVDYSLRTRLVWEPLKVYTTRLELTILCKNRGKWRVVLDMDASEPVPDDTISLIAPVGQSEQVTFKLANRFLGYSEFQAFFSSKSSPHFSVFPGTGMLPPFGSDGTPFVVTFAPTEYGQIEVANLNIVTKEAQWNYVVKGAYPDANIDHSNVKSKVDSHW